MRLSSVLSCLAALLLAAPAVAGNGPIPDEDEASPFPQPDVCAFIASAGRGLYGEHLRDFTQRQGWVDANNDGTMEQATLIAEGTSHGTRMILTQNGARLPELSMRHEADADEFRFVGWGLQDQQWLNFHGKTYLLSMLPGSDRLVRQAWAFTRDYSGMKVCGFDIRKRAVMAQPTPEAFAHFAQDDRLTPEALGELCRQVVERDVDSYLPRQAMPRVELGNGAASEAFIMADADNDGQAEKLLFTIYSSGAGAGCDGSFLTREADISTIREGRADSLPTPAKRFYAMQDVGFSGPHPNCDRSANPRLLTYAGRTFLERGDLAAPVRDARELYHELWYFAGGAALPVCRFDIEPQMRQVFP